MRAVHAVGEALARRTRLGGGEDLALDLDLLEPALAVGDEALIRPSARSQRRRPADEAFLERTLALVEQCAQQPVAISEAAKQRALADAGGTRDLIHRHAVHAPLRDEPLGGAQDRLAVARSVGALAAVELELRKIKRTAGACGGAVSRHFDHVRTVVHL